MGRDFRGPVWTRDFESLDDIERQAFDLEARNLASNIMGRNGSKSPEILKLAAAYLGREAQSQIDAKKPKQEQPRNDLGQWTESETASSPKPNYDPLSNFDSRRRNIFGE